MPLPTHLLNQKLITLAALLGALAVALGAFGAHGLGDHLSDYHLGIYNKGVLYHFIHVPVLLFLAMLPDTRKVRITAGLFIVGIAFFSGSLYLLATRELLGVPASGLLVAMTPLGGLAFMGGWLSLLWSVRGHVMD